MKASSFSVFKGQNIFIQVKRKSFFSFPAISPCSGLFLANFDDHANALFYKSKIMTLTCLLIAIHAIFVSFQFHVSKIEIIDTICSFAMEFLKAGGNFLGCEVFRFFLVCRSDCLSVCIFIYLYVCLFVRFL